MKHIERHHSEYAPAQLFDLVANVERYPEFVPWVLSAKVFRHKDKTVWTTLTMGTSLLNKRFTTIAVLDRPGRIEVSSHDPIFERFDQLWTFEPTDKGGTDIEYHVDLKFGSPIFQALVGASFAERARSMVKGYVREAQRLYGART
jgi:coenzyme Q-binding protein COQ10